MGRSNAAPLHGRRTRLLRSRRGHYGNVGFLDGEHVGAHLVPLPQGEAVGGEEAADFHGVPTQDFFEHRDEDAHSVVAEDGAVGHAGDELDLGNGDGQAVVLIDVHHDREIGTAVAHIDDVVVADAQGRTNFFEDGDFAPARGGADDGIDFSGGFVVTETRAEDVFGRNDALEGGLNDLLGRRGDDVEMDFVALGKIVESARKKGDVVFEADALAGFDQMFAPYAAKFGIVKNQIGELRALLDEVHLRQALDLVVKGVETDEFAQNDTRVVEAER